MKFALRIAWILLHVLAAISVVAFISTLVGAMVFKEFAQANHRELGMIAIFSFGLLMFSLGVIGLVTGSMFSTTFGEIRMARERYPLQWRVGTAMSIATGIGFLVWGSRLLAKWIVTS